MSQGYIILNSDSRLNQGDDDMVSARYNLKHANLDINKKYEIALISSGFTATSTVSKAEAESFVDEIIIVESNLVKNNDYVSLTDDQNKNYNTRNILAILNYTREVELNQGAAFVSRVARDELTIQYQEMAVSNLSDITIRLKDTSDNDYTANTVKCTNYAFVFKYREI